MRTFTSLSVAAVLVGGACLFALPLGLGPARAEDGESGNWKYYLSDSHHYRDEVVGRLTRLLDPWLRDLSAEDEPNAHAAIDSIANLYIGKRHWKVGFHTDGTAYVRSDHPYLYVYRAGPPKVAQAITAELEWDGDTATLSSLTTRWAPMFVPRAPPPREWEVSPRSRLLELPTYVYPDRVDSTLPETMEFRREGSCLELSWAEVIVLAKHDALAALGTEERPLPKLILLQTTIRLKQLPDRPPGPPAR